MQRLFASFVLVFFIGPWANSSTLYVNKDNACPGTGTTTDPYCSIQNALNVAVAGDDIRIRKASTPYDQNARAQSSGTSASPITIESDDPTNQAIIRYTGNGATAAAIQILDKSYWTVQNLTFDGTGVFTSTMALWVGLTDTARWTNGPDLTGIRILNNTFKNWGGSEAQESGMANQSALSALLISGGYAPPSSSSYTITGTVVQGNVFDGDRMVPVTMTSTKNSVVQNNEFKNTTCGLQPSGGGGTAVVADGIHIISGTTGIGSGDLYKNNTFHDFQSPSNCGLTPSGGGSYYEWDGLHCDVGPANGTVDGNTIWNIDPTNIHNGYGTGVHIEAMCFGWTVKNNVIYNIGYAGILHNPQSGSGSRDQYLNNTIYNTRSTGIELRYGYATVENNIIHNSAITQMYVRSGAVTSGNITIDYNDHWDLSGGNKVGSWNEGPVVAFTNWKSTCNCDAHSLNVNPLFVNPPSDFSLQLSSPCRGVGLGGIDMGAFTLTAPASTLSAPTGLTATVH